MPTTDFHLFLRNWVRISFFVSVYDYVVFRSCLVWGSLDTKIKRMSHCCGGYSLTRRLPKRLIHQINILRIFAGNPWNLNHISQQQLHVTLQYVIAIMVFFSVWFNYFACIKWNVYLFPYELLMLLVEVLVFDWEYIRYANSDWKLIS